VLTGGIACVIVVAMTTISDWDKWLEGKPEIIRKMAKISPPGTTIEIEGETTYVVSYNEDGSYGVSLVNPKDNYERACETIRKAWVTEYDEN